MFNTGQVVSRKLLLSDAADAAAYSGLLWQARALNFQAYTNRAMVANEVSIAQAVSLKSWAQYGLVSSENINSVVGSLPFIGAVTAMLEQSMRTVATQLDPIIELLVQQVSATNRLLLKAQQAMHTSAILVTPALVRDVVKANDTSFDLDSLYSAAAFASNTVAWRQFTQTNDKSDESAMRSRASVIDRSRDAFTRQRDWEFFNFWVYLSPLHRIKLYRRGETQLVESTPGQWSWTAKDTLSLQTRVWRPIRGTKRIETPVGWARADGASKHDHSLPGATSDCSGDGLVIDPTGKCTS